MMLIMLVSLYTVRVVLNTLGIIDYGIYNVVGGVVVMFSFLSNTMASASQRFFAFDIGRNDMPQLKRTFSMTVVIYAIIGLIILLFLIGKKIFGKKVGMLAAAISALVRRWRRRVSCWEPLICSTSINASPSAPWSGRQEGRPLPGSGSSPACRNSCGPRVRSPRSRGRDRPS